jgi:alpha-methylacyl-CoA racemase
LKHANIDDPEFTNQMDSKKWPELKKKTEAIFKMKTRDEWCKIMENTDVCFAPVLSLTEAMKHPHNVFRKTFVEYDGVTQPAPAPRFSRTKPEIKLPPPSPDEHNETALADWGFSNDEIEKLKSRGAI